MWWKVPVHLPLTTRESLASWRLVQGGVRSSSLLPPCGWLLRKLASLDSRRPSDPHLVRPPTVVWAGSLSMHPHRWGALIARETVARHECQGFPPLLQSQRVWAPQALRQPLRRRQSGGAPRVHLLLTPTPIFFNVARLAGL